HVGDRVRHSRSTGDGGERVFSLWDSYVWADFVTYPSQWEGWGNQFVEAVFARLPVVVFEYPVWTSDLSAAGFRVVSLGSETEGTDAAGLVTVATERIEASAREIVDLLVNHRLREEVVQHNFVVAKERYSLDVLHEHIRALLAAARWTRV
ncbi:MAG: glycosyltransferase, group 1 family protein, partial [Spirochaetota bacterium]